MRPVLLALVVTGASMLPGATILDVERVEISRLLLAEDTAEQRKVKKGKEPRPAGSFGLAVWASMLRIPRGEPETEDGFVVGAGTEAAWLFHPQLAVVVGVSFWNYRLQYDAPGFRQKYRYVYSTEVEPAFRFYPLHWEHGSLYIDTRLVYMYADGDPPARTSHSVGGGAYFGVEVGSPRIRFMVESGLGYRTAISRRDAGWLDFEDSSGAGALIWDYVRVGIRIYV